MRTLVEVLGWYGTVAIVGAYALVSFGVLDAETMYYQLLNGTGAVGIVLVSLHKRAYQPAVLNMVWTGIALLAILRLLTA